mgnify:CR=1 FL=1|tara:strand:- start:1758 stop:2489 length:732 start_codon:yes stop_codon:yes gene_type:complete
MKPAQDLTGKVFGELTAVKRVQVSDRFMWECRCSCGLSKQCSTSQLNAGKAKVCGSPIHKLPYKEGDVVGQLTIIDLVRDTKNGRFLANTRCSCGKLHRTAVKNLQRNEHNHCGCSTDYSGLGLPEGEAARNGLIGSYKGNAKTKGLVFELTTEECEVLFKGDCYFCGEKPSNVWDKPFLKGSYVYSGIDRIDSTKGYTKDNTASCCTTCNYLKSNSNNEDFLTKVMAIAKHQGTINLPVPKI